LLLLFAVVAGFVLGSRSKRFLGDPASRASCVLVGIAGSLLGAVALTIVTRGGVALTPGGMLGSLGGAILALSHRRSLALVVQGS